MTNKYEFEHDKWEITEETDNFIRVKRKRNWLGLTIINRAHLLELCEHFRRKGYMPHLGDHSWDGSVIFEKIEKINKNL